MNPEVTSLAAGHTREHIPYNDALEAYRSNSNWWTVFASFDLPDFSPSPLWISKRMGLAVEEVVEALEGLATLGFLRKEGSAFYPIKDRGFLRFDIEGRARKDLLDEHALVSQQVLNHLNETGRAAIDHRCFAANTEILKELYADVAKAFDKAFEASQKLKTNDGVFKMSFTAVDVAPKIQESKTRGN